MTASTSMRTTRRQTMAGFTMIEIMMTMAILLLLLSMLFVPIVTAFNLFSEARARAGAQDDARSAVEFISSELISAVQLPSNTTYGPSSNVTVQSRLDIVPPATAGTPPTPIVPLQPSTRVITYYVRLKDTSSAYDVVDNPLILYRAEYAPSDNWYRGNFTQFPSQAASFTFDLSLIQSGGHGTLYSHNAMVGVDDTDVEKLVFLQSDADGDSTNETVTVDLSVQRIDLGGSNDLARRPRAHIQTSVKCENLL